MEDSGESQDKDSKAKEEGRCAGAGALRHIASPRDSYIIHSLRKSRATSQQFNSHRTASANRGAKSNLNQIVNYYQQEAVALSTKKNQNNFSLVKASVSFSLLAYSYPRSPKPPWILTSTHILMHGKPNNAVQARMKERRIAFPLRASGRRHAPISSQLLACGEDRVVG